MIQAATLQFLKGLKRNNSKEWMDAHRPAYEAAKEDVIQLVQQVITVHGKSDPTIATQVAKQCLFRINRDIRFSKNKAPYKENFGASISAGGRKAPMAGYYIHIEPGASFVGGGLYMPEPAALKRLRQEIDYNADAFKKIVEAKAFRSIYGQLDTSAEFTLSRVPKGYEADHPAADYLKLKSFIALKSIDDATLQSPQLVKTLTQALAALQPLVAFINEGIEA